MPHVQEGFQCLFGDAALAHRFNERPGQFNLILFAFCRVGTGRKNGGSKFQLAR